MPDPRRSFDELIVTSGNELAIRAARSVAEAPGALYNPLIIQGPAGVGKTRLLHAIARYTVVCEPARSVLLEGSERLAELVTRGVVRGTLSSLRDALTGVDTLLLDEFDEILGMERTQEELAGAFAEMLAEGRQIVLASRLAGPSSEGLIPGLRALLADALLVEIDPLDIPGRVVVIRGLAEDRSLVLDDEVAQLLARSPVSDLGEMERMVTRLAEASGLTGQPVSADDVYALFGEGDGEREGAGPGEASDEFGSFLEEVTRTLSVVVETAPWRRRIARAILRWESEGVRTRRLDDALRADTPPDVDELIEGFARDATRLLEIRSALAAHPRAASLDDPDDLEAAESLLRSTAAAEVRSAEPPPVGDSDDDRPIDLFFLDPDRVVLDWVGIGERLAGDAR